MGLDRVDTINIVNGAITGNKIAPLTITGGNIANATITGTKICQTTINSCHFCTKLTGGICVGTGNIETCNGNICACFDGVGGVICAHTCVDSCCVVSSSIYSSGNMLTAGDNCSDGLLYGCAFRLGSGICGHMAIDGDMVFCGCNLVLYYNGTSYYFNPA